MSRTVTQTGTSVIYPSGYVPQTTDGSWYSLTNPANAYKAYDADNSKYSTIALTRGAAAYTYIYFTFDTSEIPINATIDSISCIARVFCSNGTTANIASKGAKMCSGATEKTTAVSATTTASNRTFSMGTWTREELDDVRILMYATRGTSNVNSTYSLRLYGATLTVSYTYDATYYAISGSSSITGVTITTAEADYLEGSSVTVTISGASELRLEVLDNGVDVSGDIVASGSDYIYTINNISSDHVITVSEATKQGQTIFVKQNGTWVSVDSIYVKQNGAWAKVDTLHVKSNGSWVN